MTAQRSADDDDRKRLSKHLQRLLDQLKTRRRLTNHEVRQIAGSRGMGRVHDLIQRGHAIEVRKDSGSTWLVIYHAAPEQLSMF
jgi:hypothetical protein